MSATVPAERGMPTWITWSQAMKVLGAAEVGSRPWRMLADWCGQGLIDSKATVLTGWGEKHHDDPITLNVWTSCRTRDVRLDIVSGGMSWDGIDEEGVLSPCTIVAPIFRSDQLLALLPHLSDENALNAIHTAGSGFASFVSAPPQAAEPRQVSRSNAGRKPDKVKWQSFYFALIQLAKDDRLSADSFESAAALSEEVLLIMGDGAFSPDHVKGVIGQAYRRFCNPH